MYGWMEKWMDGIGFGKGARAVGQEQNFFQGNDDEVELFPQLYSPEEEVY